MAPTRERARSYAVRMAEFERQRAEREARLERVWRWRKLCLLGEGGAWHVPSTDTDALAAAPADTGASDERGPVPAQRNPRREMRWLLCARENRFRMRLLTAPNLHFDAHELAARERDFYAAPLSSSSSSSGPMPALAHQQVGPLVLAEHHECSHLYASCAHLLLITIFVE